MVVLSHFLNTLLVEIMVYHKYGISKINQEPLGVLHQNHPFCTARGIPPMHNSMMQAIASVRRRPWKVGDDQDGWMDRSIDRSGKVTDHSDCNCKSKPSSDCKHKTTIAQFDVSRIRQCLSLLSLLESLQVIQRILIYTLRHIGTPY